MKTKTFFSASLALAAVLSMASATLAANVLNLYYDPATGNLKLQNITSSTQAFLSFDVLTLGNGTVGPVSGQPSNNGFLSTGSATLPPGAFNTSNFNPNGINGLYSQTGAINVGTTPVMTLTPYSGWSTGSPIGPAGSYWDLGNIAVLGMTQSDLNTRFVTDPESTPPGFDTSLPGKFLYSYQTGPTTFTASVGEVGGHLIPEPSTLAIAAVAAGFGGFGAVSRRRKKAAAKGQVD
jgi:hypothetical protein